MRTFAFLLYLQVIFIPIQAPGQSLDVRLLDKINSADNSGDILNLRLTQSAGPVTAAAPVVLFVLSQILDEDGLESSAYRSAIATASTAAITLSFKFITDRDRPYESYPDLIAEKTVIFTSSFPSGHTSFAFSTAMNLTMTFPKWYVAVPAFAWAGGVGYSRMHLGAHYPSDVLAGAAIGTATSWLSWRLTKWINQKNRQPEI